MFLDIVTFTVFTAGLCALLAIVISVRHINNHLNNYIVPEFQLHIVRILAMVPIYSLTAWFALIATSERTILMLDLVRDSYEAYVIYNFVVLLINYGGGHLHLCRYLEDQPRMEHPFPFVYYLPPLKLGPAFLGQVRVGVLQFVFVKPLNSLFSLYIHESLPEYSTLRSILSVIIIIVNNLSVSAALYSLVLFYHAAEPLLRPFHPFQKFIAVKAVIFFSFWQGLALSVLKRVGIIHDMPGFSADEQTTGLQDVLICVEMAIAAITHLFVFSYSEYLDHHRSQTSIYSSTAYSPIPSYPISNEFQPLTQRDHHHHQNTTPPTGTTTTKYPLLQIVDIRDVLSDAKDRIYGGVGFENELVDGAPIVPGHVFSDSISSPNSSSVYAYSRPKPGRSATTLTPMLLPSQPPPPPQRWTDEVDRQGRYYYPSSSSASSSRQQK